MSKPLLSADYIYVQVRVVGFSVFHTALVTDAWLIEQQARVATTTRRAICFFIGTFSVSHRRVNACVWIFSYHQLTLFARGGQHLCGSFLHFSHSTQTVYNQPLVTNGSQFAMP